MRRRYEPHLTVYAFIRDHRGCTLAEIVDGTGLPRGEVFSAVRHMQLDGDVGCVGHMHNNNRTKMWGVL